MSTKDWQAVQAIATIGGGLTALHGLSNKKWSEAHTAATALGVLAALALLFGKP